jgi:methionyl aminopeptidase
MNRGDLVPDDVIVGVVEERLAKDDARTAGSCSTGSPHRAQAEALAGLVGDDGLHAVVNIDVPLDEVRARMKARGRDDDTDEAIDRRLELYERETSPLIAFYESRGLMVHVDGLGTMDEVFDRLVAAIDAPGSSPDPRRRRPPNAADIAGMRRAGRVVAEMHERIRDAIRPGVTTADLDRIGRDVLERRGATSNFLGYGHPPFPAVICASPNEVLVHGIPGPAGARGGRHRLDRLRGVVDGWHGDAAFTAGWARSPRGGQRLIDVAEASLQAGIAELHDGRRLGDLGHAVQTVIEAAGFSVVREYVGHGIGRAMHERPDVPNYGSPGAGTKGLHRGRQRVRRRADAQRRGARHHGARRRTGPSSPPTARGARTPSTRSPHHRRRCPESSSPPARSADVMQPPSRRHPRRVR